jgi:hypothetical protein
VFHYFYSNQQNKTKRNAVQIPAVPTLCHVIWCIQNLDRKYRDGEGRNLLKLIYRKSIVHRVSLRSSVMLKMADSDSLLQRRHSCSLAGATLVQPIFKYFTISDAIRPTEWQEAASRKHQIAAQSIHLPGTTPYSLIM